MEQKDKQISYGNLSTFAQEIQKRYALKDGLPTQVSDLANDAGYQTADQVDEKICAKLGSTYHAGGSAAFEDLPERIEANEGLVVNVTDAFVTTDEFVEGADKKYPAGTNVVVAKVDGGYRYDVLAGFVDLEGYATREQVASDIAAAAAAVDEKLEGCVRSEELETATTEEILALFGAAGEAGE